MPTKTVAPNAYHKKLVRQARKIYQSLHRPPTARELSTQFGMSDHWWRNHLLHSGDQTVFLQQKALGPLRAFIAQCEVILHTEQAIEKADSQPEETTQLEIGLENSQPETDLEAAYSKWTSPTYPLENVPTDLRDLEERISRVEAMLTDVLGHLTTPGEH